MSAARDDNPILADLNEAQREAVLHRDGPLLVLAGPGSGKTRVITRRAAQLVRSGVRPDRILAITFTNKAAEEMRNRITELAVGAGMWVYTFHALGVRLLREFGRLARVQPGFTIYDETDQKRLVKEAMQLAKISDRLLRPEAALSLISAAKNRLERPEVFAQRTDLFDQRLVARVYEIYEQLLEQRNAVDFDDLLMRVAIVLRDQPEITARLNERFHYVLIDEYQDTNHAQYLIARHLSHHHRNICATGDPDQSIYGWRGADISNILDFEQDYPEAAVVRLEENYRSTPAILLAASKLIACNRRRKHKDLWTRRGGDEPVVIWEFDEGRDEANHIAATIEAAHADGAPYSDFAIMYRVNALSRGLEEALRLRGIPYRIARGVEFYNRKEIRDTLAYLRVVVNPADRNALVRIINTPARGIGKTTITRLIEHADAHGRALLDVVRDAENVPQVSSAARKLTRFCKLLAEIEAACDGSVADAVQAVLKLSGLEELLRKEREEGGEDRLANVAELVTAAAHYDAEADDPTLEDFLTRISLTSDQDAIDESGEHVLLLTLHAAKGLEFPVVFISSIEQGLLPHERALREGDLEEERRLCFVGITRAQRRLYLSHARQRYLRGSLQAALASQFLDELPDEACVTHSFTDDRRGAAAGRSFVPLDDHRAPDEEQPERPRLRLHRAPAEDEVIIDVAARDTAVEAGSPYADWGPGTVVQHREFGVGQVLWIRPGSGQTRASIRFAGRGEKTLILELALLTRIGPGSRPQR